MRAARGSLILPSVAARSPVDPIACHGGWVDRHEEGSLSILLTASSCLFRNLQCIYATQAITNDVDTSTRFLHQDLLASYPDHDRPLYDYTLVQSKATWP